MPKKAPLSTPAAVTPTTPRGDTWNRRRRLKRGAASTSGSSCGLMVMGNRANENTMDTRANGTKLALSPTRISHWPTAAPTEHTIM